MNGWLTTIQEFLRRLRERFLLRYQVQKIMQELERTRAILQSAQIDMTETATRLKQVKTKNPNDPLIPQLEADIDEFQRQIERRQARIEDLERQLNELDPDGSIRASLGH